MHGHADRAREAEAAAGILPLGPLPSSLGSAVEEAGEQLARWVLDGDHEALPRYVSLIDAVVQHPAFADAGHGDQVLLLGRAGAAHNWVAGAGEARLTPELSTAWKLLERARALCIGGERGLARVEYNLSNTLLRLWMVDTAAGATLDRSEAAARRGLAAAAALEDRCLCRAALASALVARFRMDGGEERITEAVALAEAALDDTPEGRSRAIYEWRLGDVLQWRFDALGAIDDLDRAIELQRRARSARFLPWQLRDAPTGTTLGSLLRRRYLRTRDLADLDEAVAVLAEEPRRGASPAQLTNLGNALLTRFDARGDIADLRGAVEAQERVLELTPPGDWQLASRHNNAGNALAVAAQATGDRDLLAQAVEHYRTALRMTDPAAQERPSRAYNLGSMLELAAGDRLSGDGVAEGVHMYAEAVRDGLVASLEWALAAALRWGDWASRRASWTEAAQAYGHALDAVQRLFREQLLREHKEAWLEQAQGLPGAAAFALVRAGRPGEAVEALERGRGLLLSEVLDQDRIDLTALAADRPELVEAYAAAATALRTAERADPTVTARLDAAIAAIRAVPGHEGFLAAPSIDEIAAALPATTTLAYLAPARAGGVALLVDTAGGVRPVDLPRCTADAVQRRVETLLGAGGPAFAGTLDAVAGWCWRAVLGPVVDAGVTHDLVLVPSGLLALLPLHAAAAPPSPGRAHAGALLDGHVVRYVPGVRALAHRGPDGHLAGPLLLVAAPQPTRLPALTYSGSEADLVAATFEPVVRLAGPGATREAATSALAGAAVVHMICHGDSRPEQPLRSALYLAGDEPLDLRTLLDLPRTRSGRRLCVLSACRTGQPGAVLPDESVSLPTGLLQVGFEGVLATQWAVRGEVAALLTGRFYQAWRVERLSPPQALAVAQRWMRDTTNEQKLTDVRAWEGPPARELIRALRLREPEERSFAHPSEWAAFSYHGS